MAQSPSTTTPPLIGTAPLSPGVATLNYAASVPGAHTYGASYVGDSNFNSFALTNASTSMVVSKSASSLSGPTVQPVVVPLGSAGSIPIAVSGAYSGPGIPAPSGNVSYAITNSSGATVASCTVGIVSGAVSIPVASSLTAGLCNVAVSYTGDANYSAAITDNIALQIGTLTPVVTYPAQTAIVYGTALNNNNLNATVVYGSTSLASAGTTTYTAAIGTGPSVPVTNATVLPAGTYTLTANWVPNSANVSLYSGATASTP